MADWYAQTKEGERNLRGQLAEDAAERRANFRAYGRRRITRSCVLCSWVGAEGRTAPGRTCPECASETTEGKP